MTLDFDSHDIDVHWQNLNSPLISIRTFEALKLNPNLLKGINKMGFHTPSRIQEILLPTLLTTPFRNLVGQSLPDNQKRVALVLAMLSKVDADKKYPQVLCLCPTKELATQTGEVAARMAKFCPEIEMKYADTDEEVSRDSTLTEHIIFGTPGKVMDWAFTFKVFDLKKLSVCVFDNADVMLAQLGYEDECIRIRKELTYSCQMIMFLDTYDHPKTTHFSQSLHDPITIRLRRDVDNFHQLHQFYMKCPTQDAKYKALTKIYSPSVEQAIIFCHRIETAKWLAEKMSRNGYTVAVFTGDLTAEQRINVLDRFTVKKEKVLITTNVLLRGTGVGEVTTVVHFDLPVDMDGRADCEAYLHMARRAGRYGRRGVVLNLIDTPQAVNICKSIEEHFNIEIKYLNWEGC